MIYNQKGRLMDGRVDVLTGGMIDRLVEEWTCMCVY